MFHNSNNFSDLCFSALWVDDVESMSKEHEMLETIVLYTNLESKQQYLVHIKEDVLVITHYPIQNDEESGNTSRYEYEFGSNKINKYKAKLEENFNVEILSSSPFVMSISCFGIRLTAGETKDQGCYNHRKRYEIKAMLHNKEELLASHQDSKVEFVESTLNLIQADKKNIVMLCLLLFGVIPLKRKNKFPVCFTFCLLFVFLAILFVILMSKFY